MSVQDFDTSLYRLGRLCPRGHEWGETGQSLLRKKKRDCIPCRQLDERARGSGRGKSTKRANYAFLSAYKLKVGCVDCGYRGHPAALHFDHLPGQIKTGELASLATRCKRSTLEKEIAKCEVVCANCHAVRTAHRREVNVA